MVITKEREIFKFRVGINECDPYKIVHNSMYFTYFEEGIVYRLIGREILAYGSKKPFKILQSRCRYIRSAKYNDELTLKTEIKKDDTNQNLIKVSQKLVDSNNTIISICKSLVKIDDERIIL